MQHKYVPAFQPELWTLLLFSMLPVQDADISCHPFYQDDYCWDYMQRNQVRSEPYEIIHVLIVILNGRMEWLNKLSSD